MLSTINTTRGISFDPNVARRQRIAMREQFEREVRTCYAEHMPGQRRWMGAKKAGAITAVSRQEAAASLGIRL